MEDGVALRRGSPRGPAPPTHRAGQASGAPVTAPLLAPSLTSKATGGAVCRPWPLLAVKSKGKKVLALQGSERGPVQPVLASVGSDPRADGTEPPNGMQDHSPQCLPETSQSLVPTPQDSTAPAARQLLSPRTGVFGVGGGVWKLEQLQPPPSPGSRLGAGHGAETLASCPGGPEGSVLPPVPPCPLYSGTWAWGASQSSFSSLPASSTHRGCREGGPS